MHKQSASQSQHISYAHQSYFDSRELTSVPPVFPSLHLNMVAKTSEFSNSGIHRFNPLVVKKPKRLFEICDLEWTPKTVYAKCQAILTVEWTTRLPLLQKRSPADLAASIISAAVDDLETGDDSKLSIVDFCSGAGGPIPVIERIINSKRWRKGQRLVPVLMTDIKPHVEAWEEAASKSDNLSFIRKPVDATDPPPSVISADSGASTSPSRILRTYCLAFHHFDDKLAKKVLESTLQTADGFAIIELQDRRVFSLLLMLIHGILVWLTCIFWFWRDPMQLFLTYVIPVIPFVMAFDGAVSSLRTREFEEIVDLIDSNDPPLKKGCTGTTNRAVHLTTVGGEWVLVGGRETHTWPLGHMNWVVGYKAFERLPNRDDDEFP